MDTVLLATAANLERLKSVLGAPMGGLLGISREVT